MPGMSFQTTCVVMSVREVAKSGGGVTVRVRATLAEIRIYKKPASIVASLGFGLFILYMFAHILHNTVSEIKHPSDT
jgi:hypothetical protein